ncbi:MAG TPA: tetratricopeptide repeat protein [Cyclobacteriaceae bacterium]|jgi:tetratricopeptide (TPR) repeat protein|nr:tetratricopeptide repeat protein [Cytophagales bacterium]HRE67270.1 tetratricopeptide repeat protein [Cyclobacteriaceae bacterium]HRF34144.1 tetratricopeptide repeat protein [Cyclobacteriaceae bacterium]
MIKLIIISVIIGFVAHTVTAQNNVADSLYNKSKTFWYNNRDSALYYLQAVLKVSVETNYAKGEANALKGFGFLSKSSTERLQHYLRALEIRQQINDSAGIGISLHDIGTVYNALHEAEKAVDYYSRSLEIKRKIEDYGGIALSLIALGHIQQGNGNFEGALAMYKESLLYRLKEGEANGIAFSYINMADAFINLKQYDSALFYCNLADRGFAESKNTTVAALGWVTSVRSKSYLGAGMLEKAFDELKDIESSKSRRTPNNILLLVEIYERKSDFKQALFYQKKWAEEKALQQNDADKNATRELVADYEFRIQQAELERKNEQLRIAKRRQDNLQFMVIAIALIAGFIFVISLRKQFPPRVVDMLMFVGFMTLFEFLIVLIDPALQEVSGDKPVFLLLGNTAVALAIAPLHSFTEKYYKQKVKPQLHRVNGNEIPGTPSALGDT